MFIVLFAAGSYSGAEAASCTPCAAGSYCSSTAATSCNPGYYSLGNAAGTPYNTGHNSQDAQIEQLTKTISTTISISTIHMYVNLNYRHKL